MPEQDTRKVQWLKQYTYTQRDIRRLEDELRDWQDMARRVQPGSIANLKLKEVEKLLEKRLVEAVEQRMLLDGAIHSVHDPIQREVLACRYIQGMGWSEVSETLHYSQQHLQRLHVAAIEALEPPPTPYIRIGEAA